MKQQDIHAQKPKLSFTRILLLAFMLCVSILIPGVKEKVVTTASAESSGQAIMWRMYNPNSGEHFYTASEVERNGLVGYGWMFEGIGWIAPASSNTPVYRMYNPNAGDHHYTINANEKDSLVKVGWNYEGIGWYSDDAKTMPLYRQYNPNAVAGAHNYTVNANERDNLVSVGWHDEGIGWYALSSSSTTTFEQDDAYASIEANVTMSGTGSGYHAKVAMSSPNDAVVSFGIQYWFAGYASQNPSSTNNLTYLVENVHSNAAEAGMVGKEYPYFGNPTPNTTYKLRLSMYKNGSAACYIDDKLVQIYQTSVSQPLTFQVEGSACYNGDTINAKFDNVRIKCGDNAVSYGTRTGHDPSTGWDLENHFGLSTTCTAGQIITDSNSRSYTRGVPSYGVNVTVAGTVSGPSNVNWDTAASMVDPTTGSAGHPLCGVAVIAQNR